MSANLAARSAPALIESAPAVNYLSNTVYIGSNFAGTERLFAVDGLEGDENWFFNTSQGILTAAAIDLEGDTYVAGQNGQLFALTVTGDPREDWPDNPLNWADTIESSPTLDNDGTVYFGSDDRRLYAVNAGEGTLRWSITTRDRITTSPLLAPDGTLYVGSNDGTFYAISTRSTGLAESSWPTLGADSQRTGQISLEPLD